MSDDATTAPIHELTALNGALAGRVFQVRSALVVGRAGECDLVLPDERLSRRHARFVTEGAVLYLEDLGSFNGSFVNGERVARRRLAPGDVVFLGTTELRVGALAGHAGDARPSSAPRRTRALRLSEIDHLHARLVKPVRPDDAVSLGAAFLDPPAPGTGAETLTGAPPTARAQQTRSLAVLYELARAVQRAPGVDAMLVTALDLLLRALGADRGCVALRAPDGSLTLRAARVRNAGASAEPTAPETALSATLARMVLEERCGVVSTDTRADARFAGAPSVLAGDAVALVAAPLLAGGEARGLVVLESLHSATRFAEPELDLLAVAASLVGVALANLALAEEREATIRALEATQRQLVATQDQLVRAEQLAAVGRVASGIAHEVKNHLSPLMLADMIAARFAHDREIQMATELMLDAQRRILGLVDEIRDFARGAGTSASERAPRELRALVAGVLRFAECDATVKRARVALAPGPEVRAEVDEARLRQVLINLLRNAADAVEPGRGRVTVRVLTEDGGVTAPGAAARAVIEVEDDGPGIPEEIAARIFEPFFSTKGERGLGLGLDISRRIVEAHGGTLGFGARAGGGTVFRVVLPRVE